jgi:tetratricopeptide (TPR) repeat protein
MSELPSDQSPGVDEAGRQREGRIKKYLHQFDTLIVGLIGTALLLTVLYGLAAGPASSGTPPTARSHLTAALVALAIAAAALAIGAFVGFLFGLPRTLTSGEARGEARSNAVLAAEGAGAESIAAGAPDRLGPGGPSPGVAVNTNLEQISDWLTKIIVGVGLTKLEAIPTSLDSFGNSVDRYFAYGGKPFGIGAGLFFMIAGFFLSYVGTRVKLSLVFVGSQRDNSQAATDREEAIKLSSTTSALDPSSLASRPNEDLRKADEEILKRRLSDLKSREERSAYANAAARQGDRKLALEILTELARENPDDQKILSDYAGVLALVGDPKAEEVLSRIRAMAPKSEPEAEDKVNIAILRSSLYDGSFEAAIDAGEALLERPIAERDAWIHIWLACAYGQRHWNLKNEQGTPEELRRARDAAVREIRRAVAFKPELKAYLRSLYDPTRSNGTDDDLQSLYPDEEIDALLAG